VDGGDAEALAARDEVLDVDVLAVGFPLALVFGLGGVGLMDGDEVFAVDVVAAFGELGEVGFAEVSEGSLEERVKGEIRVGVLEVVEDHDVYEV